MVAQSIATSLRSPLSNSLGRRPVYLSTFAVYTLTSLGPSIVDRSYPALLLRAMQSLGGATVLSLAYAVVADMTVHAKQGRFLAPMLTAANTGLCIGPVIGGMRRPRFGRSVLVFPGDAHLQRIGHPYHQFDNPRDQPGPLSAMAACLPGYLADLVATYRVPGSMFANAARKSLYQHRDSRPRNPSPLVLPRASQQAKELSFSQITSPHFASSSTATPSSSSGLPPLLTPSGSASRPSPPFSPCNTPSTPSI